MSGGGELSRREWLKVAGYAAGMAGISLGMPVRAAEPGKKFRIGVVSANIRGKSQTRNGHTWSFAQYLHPTCDFDAMQKHWQPSVEGFRKYYRNSKYTFDLLPFADTSLTHYYDSDPAAAAAFCEVYPGCKPAANLEQMMTEIDALWLGDASGFGDDHFDLIAPGLAKGLPTFCDKPIGGTVAGTKKILDFAREHKAPLMSGSLFNHQYGMEQACRMRDANQFGPIEHVSARLHSRYQLDSWMIYGQHPVWSVMNLMGAGVDAVSMLEHKDMCHAMITYPDRYPCHVWYGQPYDVFEYNRVDVYFQKKPMSFTPSIHGDFEYGHHYEMFRLAATFREMLHTGKEPKPHQEILEVTAIVHAGAKSLQEKSRLVKLAEVMSA